MTKEQFYLVIQHVKFRYGWRIPGIPVNLGMNDAGIPVNLGIDPINLSVDDTWIPENIENTVWKSKISAKLSMLSNRVYHNKMMLGIPEKSNHNG